MTAIETAMKEIRRRDGMRWVIYTDSLSSMLAIENNRENHSILKQICKVLAHIEIKGNEKADKAAN